ncbi:DUF1963 domain-containing protein [Caulobacter soli]|uniref:DUF1963 domain-containing protein n=1 Tax=Caulobacter soli TaxID=2708539 RepID=UPI0013EAE99B|nr:DUF1963 domain-containing protein [Caulobacter soli]
MRRPSIFERFAKLGRAARGAPEARLDLLRAKAARTARPSILVLREWPGSDHVSRSAFGGLPRLPPDLAWPIRAATGKPMSFIAQIDLSELPPVAWAEGLPAKGVLWFFADHDNVGLEPDAVSVLFRPGAGGAWPERPAPSDLGPLKQRKPYAWLSPGDPATRIDTHRAVRFLAVTAYDASFEEIDYDADDDDEHDALIALTDALRDAALRQVLPEPGPSDPAWYALWSTWNSEAWPRAGIFAELAVGATLDALPRVIRYLDGRIQWTPEGLAIRDALVAEARTEQARWAARRYEVLDAADRHALRVWIEAFVARAAVLKPEMMEGAHAPRLSDVERLIAKTPPLAMNMIQAHGGAAMAVLPESGRRPRQHAVRTSDYDQMLGYGRSPNEEPHWNRDNVLLLQIAADASLPWLDQAMMRLWITRSDLAAQRFDRIVTTLGLS